MADLLEALLDLADRCDAAAKRCNDPDIKKSIDSLIDVIKQATHAFCGSWLGYHSLVYYTNLDPPPPDAHFSVEYGLRGSTGEWGKCSHNGLYNELKKAANGLPFDDILAIADEVNAEAFELRQELLSLLTALSQGVNDKFLDGLLERTENAVASTVDSHVRRLQPSGTVFSRDSAATSAGIQTPPHVSLYGAVMSVDSCLGLPKRLPNNLKTEIQ